MRILRWFSIILLLGALGGAGHFFWQKKFPRTAAPASAPDEDRRAAVLYDSLGVVDFAIRQAQESQDSVPQDLIDDQARLWARYTELRSRIAGRELDSPSVASAPASLPSASTASSPATEPPQATPAADPGAMSPVESFLRQLTGWIWIVAVATAAMLGIFLWLLLRRSRAPRETVTFPKARTLRDSLAPWETPHPASREEGIADRHERPAAPARSEPSLPVPDATLPSRTVDPTFAASSWENTRTTPPASAVEPSAMQDMILSLSKRGHTPAEIARRLRLPQDQVALILKLRQAP